MTLGRFPSCDGRLAQGRFRRAEKKKPPQSAACGNLGSIAGSPRSCLLDEARGRVWQSGSLGVWPARVTARPRRVVRPGRDHVESSRQQRWRRRRRPRRSLARSSASSAACCCDVANSPSPKTLHNARNSSSSVPALAASSWLLVIGPRNCLCRLCLIPRMRERISENAIMGQSNRPSSATIPHHNAALTDTTVTSARSRRRGDERSPSSGGRRQLIARISENAIMAADF